MLARHHQVALLDPSLTRVLVVADEGERPHLVRIEPRWPDHRELVAAVGDPSAFVAAAPWREDGGTVTNVLVGDGTTTLTGAAWWPLADLDGLDGLDLVPGQADGLRRVVRERRDGAPADGRAPWWLPGWREQVVAWLDEVLPRSGHARAGELEAVKVWSLSAVLRVPVTGGELWFKATCEGFRTEPALTLAVAGLAPRLAPRVLAVDPDRAWMLMEPLSWGGAEDDVTAPEHAPAVARALAHLQLDTLAHRGTLLRAGVTDRGLEATVAGLATVCRDSVEQHLMTDEQRATARDLEPWLVEQCRTLWAAGLPDALNHGDLHLGNVAWDGRPVLYDWTDACLTHPFLDAQHLADSAAREAGQGTGQGTGGAAEEARAAVREAYTEVWRAAYPSVDVDALWPLVRVVEAAFQAVTFEQLYRAQPEAERWELAGVLVEILDKLAAARAAAAATAG
ncbi:phosphotransferase [Nocardioides marmotae]|uniref:phosphotransferase n=1 Tax=Nocardioides marmotae TaxID=2663857 RepID=UPI0012B5C031|nr:phosphotransferase [Nocardioides marmotae]MBC9735245.1 phosphotransferase [Nocardioides marmotae]MTB86345.1 phosphotransferase [Nocardioides marmotae]